MSHQYGSVFRGQVCPCCRKCRSSRAARCWFSVDGLPSKVQSVSHGRTCLDTLNCCHVNRIRTDLSQITQSCGLCCLEETTVRLDCRHGVLPIPAATMHFLLIPGQKKQGETTKTLTFCFVGCLLNVPATCECISGTDRLRQFYVLPHSDRSCRSNIPSHPVTVY